ncbi:MAG: hypothetical protein IJK89_03310 [Clostridia bacterium]|nr:hypothetical protein [Clostridia bacterium]
MIKLLLIFSFFFSSLRYAFVPTVVIDAAERKRPVSTRASGYLYGLAEYDVPSVLMTDSLSISSAAQKVTDGLQHPTGDMDHVSEMLDNADYLIVYLQDCFPTWYYANDDIMKERRAGSYDWRAFLTDLYFPMVEESLQKLSVAPYADRIVLCLFNECDNGSWFGETRFNEDGGVWAEFNEAGRDAFFEAWKMTFALARSLAPELKIGGPGYCDYNADKERDFLHFCRENECLPDVMIYHELGDLSSYMWEDHVAEYRAIETELEISPLPVIVTEYGAMYECGNPAAMLPYICAIERSGVYGDIAYWRLANNLNDNAADDNMPNSCWWLYRWYVSMEGDVLGQKKHDLFHGDFEKAVKSGRDMKYKDFSCLASLNKTGDRLEAICGNCSHTGQLVFTHLKETDLGAVVRVQIEEVVYKGLSGAVTKPIILRDENVRVFGGRLTVKLKDMKEGSVYRVTLSPQTDYHEAEDQRPVRYEAEHGTLLGNAYTYDSAYASTGEIAGIVGGMENDGDGVELIVNAPQKGEYSLDIIYGKHNDGGSPDRRVSGKALLTVNNGDPLILTLPNTIKSEYTNCLTVDVTLKKGGNSLRFEHLDGTFVLDSVLAARRLEPLEPSSGSKQKDTIPIKTLALLPYHEYSGPTATAWLTVAPDNGYYTVICDTSCLSVDGAYAGAVSGGIRVYLRRGLNLLTLQGNNAACTVADDRTDPSNRIAAHNMTLTGLAADDNGVLKGIGSRGGAAQFIYNADSSGDYRVTICYSNNAEGGYHAYNVDLIEQYFTVTVNGQKKQVMCRNTYSEENDSTVTFNVTLREGENIFHLANDGTIRFNGQETDAPHLKWITVNRLTLTR